MGMHTWPLYNFLTNLVVLPSSSSDPLPGSHTYSGRVSQPCRRPTSRPRGRAARFGQRGLGSAGRSTTGRCSPPPPLPPSRSRPRWTVVSASTSERTARPPRLTAVEGPVAGHPEAAYPDGPPGSCSNRDRHCQRPVLPGISSTLRLA